MQSNQLARVVAWRSARGLVSFDRLIEGLGDGQGQHDGVDGLDVLSPLPSWNQQTCRCSSKPVRAVNHRAGGICIDSGLQ